MARARCQPHRAVIIGEAPSPDRDIVEPLCIHTTSGRRLADVLPGDYERDYRRRNVIEHRVRPGKWNVWHKRRAAAQAGRILFEWDAPPILILLGRQVAEAFGVDYRPCRATWIGNLRVLVIPHPSGLNRWWNGKGNRAKVRRFLRRYVTDTIEESVPRRSIIRALAQA